MTLHRTYLLAPLLLTVWSLAPSFRHANAQPLAPLALPARKEVVWDRRAALTAPDAGWSVVFENGAALLTRGEERAALAVAAPHWLLRERVQHVLGMD